MFEFGMVKLMILLLTGPFIEFDWFFLLKNIRKIDGTFKSVRAIHGIRSIRVRGTEVWLYLFQLLPCEDGLLWSYGSWIYNYL
jgi:hypothetical protein